MTSEEIEPPFAAAWVQALAEFRDIPRTRTANAGTRGNYRYVQLTDVHDITRPTLQRHGLAISQDARYENNTIVVHTTVEHQSGESRTWGPFTIPATPTAQAIGSALTYARRYHLMTVCGIAADDDDDDGGAASAPTASTASTATRGSLDRRARQAALRADLADMPDLDRT